MGAASGRNTYKGVKNRQSHVELYNHYSGHFGGMALRKTMMEVERIGQYCSILGKQ
jgi:hypothetical protein